MIFERPIQSNVLCSVLNPNSYVHGYANLHLCGTEGLSPPTDHDHQFPVHYAHDYLRGGIPYLKLPALRLNDYMSSGKLLHMGHDLPCGPETETAGRS